MTQDDRPKKKKAQRDFFTPELLLGISCFATLFAVRAVLQWRSERSVDARMLAPVDAQVIRLDLNRCDALELSLLPGVGQQLSLRIIVFREANGPFKHVEDLSQVRGIGEANLRRLRPFVEVGDLGVSSSK